MPTYLTPGVYVEEVQSGARPIEGVGTAVAAFVGFAQSGPFHEPTPTEASTSVNRHEKSQATGGGRLTHFVCVDGRGEALVPCGRCRQLLYEFGGPALVLETPTGRLTLDEMLPQAFGPGHLAK